MALQEASSSSSSFFSFPDRWPYDVFLSFRGEDTRNNFTAHLYDALHRKGINTYIDCYDLRRGNEISQALLKAIEESRIAIIILSQNYASSTWCLDELMKILDCNKTRHQIILPVFYKVDPSEVRHQRKNFREAFAEHQTRFKDDMKVRRWKETLEEVANLSGFHLGNRNESEFINEIVEEASRIVNHTYLSVAKYPVGLESHIHDINLLLSIGMNDIRMIGILGVGGIGKTTVAKAIYNLIAPQFDASCFVADIRENSNRSGGLMHVQEELLRGILGNSKSLKVGSVDKGINVIEHRLCSKKILLILDDVDKLVQLESLAGDHGWFGLGSRIIITTRDRNLLESHEVDSIYKMNELDHDKALQLFSLHAFKREKPIDDYVELTEDAVRYTGGLPLALTVIGSDLKGRSISQWKSALDKLKQIPNKDIQKILETSYDGLDDNEKNIFLDIACFFKTEDEDYVIKILERCGFFPGDGIPRLVEKCLISVDQYRRLWMHDLLQDMGKEIVKRESPKEPGERSRLWFPDDVRSVLEENTGPNKVEGILLDLPEGDHDEIYLHPEAFGHMKRLRVFINRNARFSCGPNYLPENLRLLDWSHYPSHSLPHNFRGRNLVVFKIRDSLIKKLGNGFNPKNLTTMNIEDCNFIEKIPDLSSISNLKELSVDYCRRLVEVHDSVGYLENLSLLCFYGCTKLRILPRRLKLRSLSVLLLCLSPALRDLPEMECEMTSLTDLSIDGVAIEELPLSVMNLTNLHFLYLRNCTNLVRLPITCIQLPRLNYLEIRGCPNLVTNKRDCELSLLPIESAAMEDEITLTSSEEQLHELVVPTNSSNGSTASLQVSNLQISCSQSESSFFPLYSFLSMLNSSSTLGILKLSEIEIVRIPTSIIGFVKLRCLTLVDCKKLEEIPELPPNLQNVCVRRCKSLERFREVSRILEFNGSHIPSRKSIELEGCDKMQENIWNWNDKVQNHLLWKGLYACDATFYPETNQIPEWFSNVYDFLKDIEMEKPDDDVRPWRKEEWAIDIEGPHRLDEISGILLYAVMFYNDYYDWSAISGCAAGITCNSSNYPCFFESGVELATRNVSGTRIGYNVWVWYSNLQSFGLKVLDNLLVQFHFPSTQVFYRSCRAKILYKNERRAKKIKRKMNHPQFNLRTWRRLFYRSCGAKILYKNERRAKKRKRNGKMDVADVAKSHDDH